FRTIIHSARSVQRCSPAITLVVSEGSTDFSVSFKISPFRQHSTDNQELPSFETFNFQRMLAQLVNIGSPATDALTCLESNEADTGHVYLFSHAIIGNMLDILQSKEHGFPTDVQDEVRTIIYYCHNEIMGKQGQLYSPIYLATVYLNP
ncbi:hypothetical protein ARMGADRAFT_870579, partial [Armillaria gallica]